MLQFDYDLFPVQHQKDAEDNKHEYDGPQKGGELVCPEIFGRRKGNEPPALCENSRNHEGHQRIGAQDLEWGERLLDAFDVDDVHQERKGQHCPAAGIEDIGSGPERFRNRDGDAQDHCSCKGSAAVDERPQGDSVRGVLQGSFRVVSIERQPVPGADYHRPDEIAKKAGAGCCHRSQKPFGIEVRAAVAVVAVVASDQPSVQSD